MSDDMELSVTLAMQSGSFQQQIQAINRSMKVVQSEFEAASSKFEEFGNETDKLGLKNQSLAKQIDLGKQKVKLFADAVEKSEKVLQESLRTNEQLENKIKETARAYDESVKATGRSSDESKKLKNELDGLNSQLRTNENEIRNNARNVDNYKIKLNQAEKAVNSLEKELKSTNNQFDGQKKGLSEVAKEAEKAGNKFDDFKEKISGVGGKIAALGSALAIGAIVKATVNTVDDLHQALNGLAASTGTSNEQMDGLKDAMLEIYSDNFGESFEDIGLAMRQVAQQTGLTGDALKDLTENALTIRDTFDLDVNESVRSANMLMQQFGVTGEEAYNLIAQGAQKGLDKNGDLLDTVNEYSVHFQQLGINADEMFNMLVNGAKAGTWSVDKLGDAVKEFGIRAKDGSKKTQDAFKELGLDVDATSKAFAKGGEEGKKAFEEVNKKLLAMDDPLKQNIIGVALYGTMWEDLGVKGIKALVDTRGEISKTSDALEKINEIKYNDFGSALEGIKRQLVVGLAIPLGEKLLPKLNELANYLKENLPRIVEQLGPVLSKVVDAFIFLADNLNVVIPLLTTAFGAMMAFKGVSAVNSVLEIFGTSLGTIAKSLLGFGGAGKVASQIGAIGASASTAGVALGETAGAIGVAGGTSGLIGSLGGAVAAAAPFVVAAGSVALAGYGVYKYLSQDAVPAVDLFAYKVEEAADRVTVANDKVASNQNTTSAMVEQANQNMITSYSAVSSLSTTTSTNISNGYSVVAQETQQSVTVISEATKQAVGAYMKMDDDVKKTLISLYANGTKLTSDTVNSLVTQYNAMGLQIKTGMDQNYNDDLKIMQTFFANSTLLTDEEEKKALESLQTSNNDKKAQIDEYTKQIKGIYEQAMKDHGQITLEDQQQVNKIQDEMRKNAVNTLSENEIEAKVIMDRMKEYGSRITKEQASEVIKNAEDQRTKSVDAANRQYEETKRAIENMQKTVPGFTQHMADEMIEDADRQRRESISKANQLKDGVVSNVVAMDREVIGTVDLTTGRMYSKFDIAISRIQSAWNNFKLNAKEFIYTIIAKTTFTYENRNDRPIDQHASGTLSYAGGLTSLNERGYEIFDLPRGTRIYNHQASVDMAIKTAEEIAKGILGSINLDNSKQTTVVVPVNLNGKEIARVIAPNISEELGNLNRKNLAWR